MNVTQTKNVCKMVKWSDWSSAKNLFALFEIPWYWWFLIRPLKDEIYIDRVRRKSSLKICALKVG